MTREELYALVWAEPMLVLGGRLGLSAGRLVRICDLLNVPRPKPGHWSKLAAGKAPAVPPLPAAMPGDRLEWIRDAEFAPAKRPGPASAPAAASRERASTRRVRIPRDRTHGLVREARQHFERGYSVEEGALLRPYKQLMADVTSSRACLDRTLGLASDLYNAFESVGHRVVLAAADSGLYRGRIDEREAAGPPRERWERRGPWSPGRPTVVLVGPVAIGIAVIEMTEEVDVRYADGRWIRASQFRAAGGRTLGSSWTGRRELPSGRLRIVAYAPHPRIAWTASWQETGATSLRSRIGNIVREVEDAAPGLEEMKAETRRAAEAERAARQAADERRDREEDRRRTEQSVVDSRADLQEVIRRWREIVDVERFLLGVEQRAASLDADERARTEDRLRLAREFLGSQDPLDHFRSWRTPLERHFPRF